ncbi:MAG: hypothetical protein OEM85_03715 [Gammaproteobacteria bacterium]|nr:hypothetical protein [Gammaproteobacteria bacterium]MDH3372462.1 hypothetical protein [Gammaproteobacteria bacterium]MDH3407898.1 hypothetical protein [Gammaproteobacteria bacterium]
MRKTAQLIILTIGAMLTPCAWAQPDRESLIEAWETHVATLPGTTEFEALGDGTYRLQDTDLPYDGELKLVGALVRAAESPGFDTGFTHFGMVDIELTDLPQERLSSQSYYYWLADRQTLHYSETEQRWMGPVAYQSAITQQYSPDRSFRGLNFMLNYGIWVFLIALIIFVFVGVSRQAKKARSLMDQTEDINRRASENLDRSEQMRDEVMAVTREMRDLQLENNELLKKILDAMTS